MDFSDALIHLKTGARIARKYWDGAKEIYIAPREEGEGDTICFTGRRGHEGIWIPSNRDLLSDDWELAKVSVNA
jgi:hypothetical protein